MKTPRPWLEALAGAIVLAAACTLGDFLWIWIAKPHPWWMGVLHGVGMFALVGCFLGLLSGDPRRAVRGILASIAISAVLSGSFYLLYPLIDPRITMLLLWLLLWVCFGLIQSWLCEAPLGSGLRRGACAALLCGLAFYLLVLPGWTGQEMGLVAWLQFGRWTGVFLAAFLPLRLGLR
ncbi:hypothetical protein JYT15_00110 [Acidimicrobium ferrooxidans]|nr:hypothetical protein [Acidimicrobium ferrooxidans]